MRHLHAGPGNRKMSRIGYGAFDRSRSLRPDQTRKRQADNACDDESEQNPPPAQMRREDSIDAQSRLSSSAASIAPWVWRSLPRKSLVAHALACRSELQLALHEPRAEAHGGKRSLTVAGRENS